MGCVFTRRGHLEVEQSPQDLLVHELERQQEAHRPRPAISPTTGLHSATRPIRGDDQSAASRSNRARIRARFLPDPKEAWAFESGIAVWSFTAQSVLKSGWYRMNGARIG